VDQDFQLGEKMSNVFNTLPSVLTAGLLCAATVAQADNLMDVYRLAKEKDLTLAQARSAHQASRARADQETGQILPAVGLTASRLSVTQDIQQPVAVTNDYDSDSYSLQLVQPLFRMPAFAAWSKGREMATQADAELAVAEGEVIIRVAQAYFDQLAAEDALSLARTQKTAIEGQLKLAQRNFAVGGASVVDVHEARARFDQAAATELLAENDLEIRREALVALIDRRPQSLAKLAVPFALQAPEPGSADAWVKIGLEKNPLMVVYDKALKVAEEETAKNRGAHYPTLDLVASHSYNKNGSVFSASTYEYTTNAIGAQLTVPIYNGGIVQAKVREAEAKREQAQASLDSARRTITRLAREGFVAVTAGIRRVQALEQAETSSRRALESTLLGYESGTRTGVDVLNAQREYYRTQFDLSQARYAYVLAQFRLRLAAGTLSESDLSEVNRALTGN